MPQDDRRELIECEPQSANVRPHAQRWKLVARSEQQSHEMPRPGSSDTWSAFVISQGT